MGFAELTITVETQPKEEGMRKVIQFSFATTSLKLAISAFEGFTRFLRDGQADVYLCNYSRLQ